jgi:carbamoyl-phosphate synthase large subunit
MNKLPKKVLVLGSGALKIGEAGEFDYSGSQALKALKEEGIKTILINPNIATIQTSPLLADQIYFLPVNPYFVERVIAKERPDAIFLSFGGQTALNCGIALQKSGVLKKYKVRILGTPIQAIILTEDREKFASHLRKLKIPVPPSAPATTVEQAQNNAQHMGYPVMIRAAFALGGQKSGVAHNDKELNEIAGGALAVSPQVLVEKYLHHWKEIEYEVVRDRAGNCATVCNMENFDPLGIHTGDSIVVAPSQTLNNFEYHGLRKASIDIVQSLGIIGECNVQFAVNANPKTRRLEYGVIEVNARLSRSSALASKATGYPLAYVAAKLGLGKLLSDVPNQVTKVTQSFFEPALDYIVVKIPRWDLEKFKGAEEHIGSAMKSVGEVMSIGRTFEEAIQKGVRMLSGQLEGVTENGFADVAEIKKFLVTPTPKRLFAAAAALKHNMTVAQIHKLTGIDAWFLYRLQNIVKKEQELRDDKNLDATKLRTLKQLGFSDKRIGKVVGKSEKSIQDLRKSLKITPSVFQIDTLAGEVPAPTNYLYLTYNGSHHDVKPLGKNSVMVLGSGPYHIGSSVEFDWSCVHTALELKKYGKKSIIINCNPETVSTDYDMSDRLYFEDLNFETIAAIYDFEQSEGVVISVGGQRPNNLAKKLASYKAPILGTKAADIDRAEDRGKFSALLDELDIAQPYWTSVTTIADAKKFARKIGYPVLVRPSYVLSGSAMNVCFNEIELELFVHKAAVLNSEHPVTVSKFFTNAKEIELDAVAQNGEVQVYAVSEHIENAGVHSGDATIAHPPQKVFMATEHQIVKVMRELATRLKITGPFNIQFLVKDNRVFVIELNVRASRTFPFISKVTGVNFAEKIVASFFNKSKPQIVPYVDYVAVKSPQFSFARLAGADPVLRVEMSSTGEVACFGRDLEEALLKSIIATTGFSDKKAVLVSIGGAANKERFREAAQRLVKIGFTIYATDTTAEFLNQNGIKAERVHKVYERKKPDIVDLINEKKIAFVVNISDETRKPEQKIRKHITDGYLIRRASVDNNIPLFTDLQLARSFVKALKMYGFKDLEIKSWSQYVGGK